LLPELELAFLLRLERLPSVDFETRTEYVKIDESLGLVFGFGLICKIDGEDYYDVQGDNPTEEGMLEASADFMQNSRIVRDMHKGDPIGTMVFAFPLTTDIAKAFDITTPRTGLMIGMKPSPEVLAKFKSGEYTGFSFGGKRLEEEVVEP
jgi:hypothetical protein